MEIPHIIITGNPVDGFEYIGPFPSYVDAKVYVITNPYLPKEAWWIAPLYAPAEE